MDKYFHRNWFGILGVITGVAWVLAGTIGVLLAAIMAVLALHCLLRRRWRDFAILLVATLLGFASAHYAAMRQEVLPRSERGVYSVRIDDPNAIGVIPGDEDAVVRQVTAELLDGDSSRIVRLEFPYRVSNTSVSSGEVRQVSGILRGEELPVEYLQRHNSKTWKDVSERFDHGSFAHYLAAHGVTAPLTVEAITPPQKEFGESALARLRRTLLRRLDTDLSSAQQRAVLGAIVLGMRGRLSSQTRHLFRRTGVVHLFSVSGLHVGVLAALLLLLMRPLPLFWHVFVLITIVGYVMITGSNAPAIRAFLLVIAAEFLRARALYVRPLEILGLIGAVLLLFNPFYLNDAGFQFSFVITGFLILSVQPAREIAFAGRGDAARFGNLSPFRKRLYHWRGMLLAALFIAAAASVSGMALSLYHQNYYFAGAMLVNLLILPVLTPLFAVATLKCALPALSAIWNPILKALLGWMETCIEWSEEFTSFNEYSIPGAVSVILFGALLALVLLTHRRRFGALALAGVLLWMASRFFAAGFAPPVTAVFISGGSLREPVVAILQPWAHSMKVLNAGYDGVYPLANVAKSYGVSRISEVGFGRASLATSGGLGVLKNFFKVEKLRLPAKPSRSRQFDEMFQDEPFVESGAPESSLQESVPGGAVEVRWETTPRGTYIANFGKESVEVKRTAGVRVFLVELRP